jgi:hypothetical protein
MAASIHRVLAAAVLALCATVAAANVAQAASALDHACCHRAPAESSAAPDSPCDGFLPLTCCRAAALPTAEPGAAVAPFAVALVDTTPIVAPPRRVALRPPSAVVRGPTGLAARRTVVLLI